MRGLPAFGCSAFRQPACRFGFAGLRLPWLRRPSVAVASLGLGGVGFPV